ncbi:MAG: UbiD family decarboxylase, partial [Anaerolineales bacterium]|nr:UbiD family decarboxylase [Anaerolineales bacterium]
MNLRDFLALEKLVDCMVTINQPVDIKYEMANVAHALDGRPVLFNNLKNYTDWRVLTGPCSDRRFFAMALDTPVSGLLNRLVSAVNEPKEPPINEIGFCQQEILPDVDLNRLPILHHLVEDAGPYMTSAVVIVRDRDHGRNMAYHRMLRLNAREFVVRLVEGRGTHMAWSKSDGDLPCAICVGVPLQVCLAAAMSPPPGVDELKIAHALSPTPLVRCKSIDLCVPAEAELVLEGRITKRFVQEGPFPDLTETMDLIRQGQVIEI